MTDPVVVPDVPDVTCGRGTYGCTGAPHTLMCIHVPDDPTVNCTIHDPDDDPRHEWKQGRRYRYCRCGRRDWNR